MILRIVEAEVCGQHQLRLTFNDGTRKTVDVGPLLSGPVFDLLRDPDYLRERNWTACAARWFGRTAPTLRRSRCTNWRQWRSR